MHTIRRAVQIFIETELLGWERVATLKSLKPSPAFNVFALDARVSYEQVYLAGLQQRYFNFVLADQSYLQFSEFDGCVRFAYYPNPFTDPDGLLELLDDPTDFGLFDLRDLVATAGRSPLRFDMALNQYVEFSHPFAHFHLGHGELGRLASERVFCPFTFSMLIIRLYYPEAWEQFILESPDHGGFTNKLDSKFAVALSEDGMVNVAHFTHLESKLPHLS